MDGLVSFWDSGFPSDLSALPAMLRAGVGASALSGMPSRAATVTGTTGTSRTLNACSSAPATSSTALREAAHTCRRPWSRFQLTSKVLVFTG